MKTCTKCGETKELTEFNKSNRNKSGVQSHCKVCNKQYRKANKDKIANTQKQYRDNNKDKIAKNNKLRRLSALPCVYRIQSKTSGLYYIGSTTYPLCERISKHFHKTSGLTSPFTGKDRDNWEWYQLCTGNAEQMRELEKYMLSTIVGIDENCINLRVG